MARTRNLSVYGDPPPDAAALAAAYAFRIVKDHPFVDGNKRVGFVAAATFLMLNGKMLDVDEHDVVKMTMAVASGELNDVELADWLNRGIARCHP